MKGIMNCTIQCQMSAIIFIYNDSSLLSYKYFTGQNE